MALSGELTATVKRDGKVISSRTYKNLVMLAPRSVFLEPLTEATPQSIVISHFAVGSGNTPPVETETQLVNETARVQKISLAKSDNVVTASAVFTAGTATGQNNEAGIFGAATITPDSGILISRVLIDELVDELDSLFLDWKFTLVNS